MYNSCQDPRWTAGTKSTRVVSKRVFILFPIVFFLILFSHSSSVWPGEYYTCFVDFLLNQHTYLWPFGAHYSVVNSVGSHDLKESVTIFPTFCCNKREVLALNNPKKILNPCSEIIINIIPPKPFYQTLLF